VNRRELFAACLQAFRVDGHVEPYVVDVVQFAAVRAYLGRAGG